MTRDQAENLNGMLQQIEHQHPGTPVQRVAGVLRSVLLHVTRDSLPDCWFPYVPGHRATDRDLATALDGWANHVEAIIGPGRLDEGFRTDVVLAREVARRIASYSRKP